MRACLMVLWSHRSCVKASTRLFISARLFLTVPGGMLCVRRLHLAVGSRAKAVRTSLCKQVLKRVLKTRITAHPFSSAVAPMNDSSTSVCVCVCLGGAAPSVVWWLCCVCRHRLCQSAMISLQLITSVADFHPSLLWLGHLPASFQWGFLLSHIEDLKEKWAPRSSCCSTASSGTGKPLQGSGYCWMLSLTVGCFAHRGWN